MTANTFIIQGPASTIHLDRAQFKDDPEFLVEIIGLFLSTCPELLSSIEDAVRRKDAPGLRRAAHTLKGSVGTFGAEEVVEQAFALEIIEGMNGNFSTAEETWRMLRERVDKLASEMQAVLNEKTSE